VGNKNTGKWGGVMDDSKEFTRPVSNQIKSILSPIIGTVGEFTIYRNEPSGIYVRITFHEQIFLDVFHKTSEGWMVELWKVTKKKTTNKQFGLHRHLLVPNHKNINNGQVVVNALLPILESFLVTTPLSKHLSPDQIQELQVNIANYRDKKKEDQIRQEVIIQDLAERAQNSSKSRTSTIVWVIVALVALAILGSSGSGNNGCDFYPDPRGGFTDCS
jgi:hypothetical protein